MPNSPLRTPLHDWHASHGGRMVEFGGWSMPVQYTSIVDEHHTVRRRAGLFDISHMGRLDFQGDALPWLEHVTTNHVARLEPGQIQYSLVANEAGGIIDDVLVYRQPQGALAMVCNASNRQRIVDHLEAYRPGHGGSARVVDRTFELAMIAVQGPHAVAAVRPLAQAALDEIKYYHACSGTIVCAPALFSRTGYTGEDGFEIMVPAEHALALWEALLGQQAAACGLGARDTLRFEAAMPLYGHELSESIDPFEAGLSWAVKLAKGPFIGRDALKARKQHRSRARVGLELSGKRIAREGSPVSTPEGAPAGVVTSGTFSPTLERSLAMALVDKAHAQPETLLTIDIRGHRETARVVPLPFYRRPGS